MASEETNSFFFFFEIAPKYLNSGFYQQLLYYASYINFIYFIFIYPCPCLKEYVLTWIFVQYKYYFFTQGT